MYNQYADISRWLSLSIYLLVAAGYLARARKSIAGEQLVWLLHLVRVFIAFAVIWLVFLVPYEIPRYSNALIGHLLENAVEQLPEKYRLVFVLREVEELSVKETSEILDIEASNVKTRLNRAKNMLREQLKGYMKEHVYSFHLTRCDRIVAGVLNAIGG